MRRILTAAALLLSMLVLGCTDRAEELYQTAQFEERQFNREHAVELYRRIIDQHPGSPYAEQARRRLAELEQN